MGPICWAWAWAYNALPPGVLQAGDLAAVLEVERQAVAALRGEEVEQLRAALPLVRQVRVAAGM